MEAEDTKRRSEDACPACGLHRLALQRYPEVHTTGVQPYSELLGMGELNSPPGIVCLACGSSWADLQAFRRAQSEAAGREPGV